MEKKYYIITIYLAILSLDAGVVAQNFRNINGTVRSIFDNKPVPYATVTIAESANSNNKQTTTTDSQGRYNIDRITGIHDIPEMIIPTEGTQSTGIEGEIAYYGTPEDATITIYNLLGQKIKEINQENRSTGIHTVDWGRTDQNGARVASGVYIYTIRQDQKTLTGKTNVVHRQFSGIDQTLQSITQKEQQEQIVARNTQQQNSRQEQQRLGKTTGRTEYTITIKGTDIWGWQTTFSTAQDTTINQYVKDKVNMPAEVMERYNDLSKKDPRLRGTGRTLKPLTVHFVADTLDNVQKQWYEIFKQKAALIRNAPINNLDQGYFKNKKFEIGKDDFPNTPDGMHQIYFGDAHGFAAATAVDVNTTTAIINRAVTVYDQIYLNNMQIGLETFDVSATKEIMTGESYFARNDDTEYEGLFNSRVRENGKDFKNPSDITMMVAHFMNPPNTMWDAIKQMEIAPGWQNYLSKSANGNMTMITYTAKDGSTYRTISNKSLEQVMQDNYKP